ncbi:MAG: hypothetical protein IPJ13_10470 [Saprospiraceae bacterium]|nr:hypothetical protein [Saprospiraceae bacterium]
MVWGQGGAAMNFQSWGDGVWGSVNQDPLFSLNGDLFIESYDEFKKGALYAQAGFHVRGSSFRFLVSIMFFQNSRDFNSEI